MGKDDFINAGRHGDTVLLSMNPIPEGIKEKLLDALAEDIANQPLVPLHMFTPDNPPPKNWLSNLPIVKSIKPEFIRPKDSQDLLRCPFEINNRTLKELIEESQYTMPLQIITSKEKTVMQAKTVFDLYFKRAYEALNKAEEDQLDQLVEEDENTKLIDKTFKQLNDSLMDVPKDYQGFHLYRARSTMMAHCTCSTRKKVEEWSERVTKERKWLDRMHEEVEAQLLSCETYEQAREILRTYDIIDCCGEMQEYKPF